MSINLLNEKDLNDYLAELIYNGEEIVSFSADELKNIDIIAREKDNIIRAMIFQLLKNNMQKII